MRPTRYFEDYALGDRFVTDSLTVTEGQIMQYARAFDTNMFHVDMSAAADGPFDGIIASGFQTMSLSFALFFKLQLVQPVARGGAGMEKVRWTWPLRAGDTIHMRCDVIGLRTSPSRPDRGTVRMRHDTINQDGRVIMTLECLHLIQCRPDGAA